MTPLKITIIQSNLYWEIIFFRVAAAFIHDVSYVSGDAGLESIELWPLDLVRFRNF